MSKHMERDLDKLQRLVLSMAGLAEQAVYRAAAAVRDRDPEQARAVVAGDSEIDRLESELQEECLKILALHSPVAVDLRKIAVVMLIATDLERAGDLAVGIAERFEVITGPSAPPVTDRLMPMADRAADMLRQAMDAFVHADAAAARRVIRQDDAVDADNAAIILKLISDLQSAPEHIAAGLALFIAVRNLERIADHATNIAEDVIYLVEGATVRHMPGAAGPE